MTKPVLTNEQAFRMRRLVDGAQEKLQLNGSLTRMYARLGCAGFVTGSPPRVTHAGLAALAEYEGWRKSRHSYTGAP